MTVQLGDGISLIEGLGRQTILVYDRRDVRLVRGCACSVSSPQHDTNQEIEMSLPSIKPEGVSRATFVFC